MNFSLRYLMLLGLISPAIAFAQQSRIYTYTSFDGKRETLTLEGMTVTLSEYPGSRIELKPHDQNPHTLVAGPFDPIRNPTNPSMNLRELILTVNSPDNPAGGTDAALKLRGVMSQKDFRQMLSVNVAKFCPANSQGTLGMAFQDLPIVLPACLSQEGSAPAAQKYISIPQQLAFVDWDNLEISDQFSTEEASKIKDTLKTMLTTKELAQEIEVSELETVDLANGSALVARVILSIDGTPIRGFNDGVLIAQVNNDKVITDISIYGQLENASQFRATRAWELADSSKYTYVGKIQPAESVSTRLMDNVRSENDPFEWLNKLSVLSNYADLLSNPDPAIPKFIVQNIVAKKDLLKSAETAKNLQAKKILEMLRYADADESTVAGILEVLVQSEDRDARVTGALEIAKRDKSRIPAIKEILEEGVDVLDSEQRIESLKNLVGITGLKPETLNEIIWLAGLSSAIKYPARDVLKKSELNAGHLPSFKKMLISDSNYLLPFEKKEMVDIALKIPGPEATNLALAVLKEVAVRVRGGSTARYLDQAHLKLADEIVARPVNAEGVKTLIEMATQAPDGLREKILAILDNATGAEADEVILTELKNASFTGDQLTFDRFPLETLLKRKIPAAVTLPLLTRALTDSNVASTRIQAAKVIASYNSPKAKAILRANLAKKDPRQPYANNAVVDILKGMKK